MIRIIRIIDTLTMCLCSNDAHNPCFVGARQEQDLVRYTLKCKSERRNKWFQILAGDTSSDTLRMQRVLNPFGRI